MAGIYKIGVLSRKVGLSPGTLRLWEDQFGLLTPDRSSGGTRLYSDADVERARYIRKLLRDRGYTLESIARILEEARQASPPTLDRAAIENIYLREATNRAYIEEGRRMTMVQATLRSLIRAESGQQAAMTLVTAVKALTGADSAGLGLYRRTSHTLVPVVTDGRDGIRTWPGPPLSISEFPREWQEAIDAREPYADPDLLRLDLPVEVNSQVIQDRTRSFHAEPLAIANEMVGVLTIASWRPGGMGREAEQVCERLALAAGPAIHYFARHFGQRPPAAAAL
jgi:DNA-binding transcriptional MerR regulator